MHQDEGDRRFTSEDYSDRHAEVFAARYDDGVGDRKIRTVAALVGDLGRRRVIDVGCGIGNFSNLAATSGAEVVVPIDFAQSMVSATHQRYPSLPLVRGSAIALPTRASTFDVAFALDVIEHLYEPHTLVDELRRVLKPGGIAVVTTDRDGFALGLLPRRVFRQVRRLASRRGLKRPGWAKGVGPRSDWQRERHDTPLCTHTYEFPLPELIELFAAKGFVLTSLDTYPHSGVLSGWGRAVELVVRGPLRRYKWDFVACCFRRDG